jgi:hypothetical protein
VRRTVQIVSPVVVVEMEPLVDDCESGGGTAEGEYPPAPGSFVLPGWRSIEEELESGEAMETGGCIEVEHSLRVSLIDVDLSPLTPHKGHSSRRGRRPGMAGED